MCTIYSVTLMGVINAMLALAIYKLYGTNCVIKGTYQMNDGRRTAAASSRH